MYVGERYVCRWDLLCVCEVVYLTIGGSNKRR